MPIAERYNMHTTMAVTFSTPARAHKLVKITKKPHKNKMETNSAVRDELNNKLYFNIFPMPRFC